MPIKNLRKGKPKKLPGVSRKIPGVTNKIVGVKKVKRRKKKPVDKDLVRAKKIFKNFKKRNKKGRK